MLKFLEANMTNAYFFHLVHLTDEFNLKKLGGTQINAFLIIYKTYENIYIQLSRCLLIVLLHQILNLVEKTSKKSENKKNRKLKTRN